MPHELVRPPERSAHDVRLVEHDRVLERRALDQPLRPQRLDFVHESERSRRRQLASRNVSVRHADTVDCRPISGCGELDRDIELEVVRRKRFVDGFAVDDSHRLRETSEYSGCPPSAASPAAAALRRTALRFRRGSAARARPSRSSDRRSRCAATAASTCSTVCTVFGPCPSCVRLLARRTWSTERRNRRASRTIRATEQNALPERCRHERQPARLAKMQPHALERDAGG